MDIELLAKQMREAALRVEKEIENQDLNERLEEQRQRDALRKLYFNAGRWAGGARDRVAKEAFQKVSNGE